MEKGGVAEVANALLAHPSVGNNLGFVFGQVVGKPRNDSAAGVGNNRIWGILHCHRSTFVIAMKINGWSKFVEKSQPGQKVIKQAFGAVWIVCILSRSTTKASQVDCISKVNARVRLEIFGEF